MRKLTANCQIAFQFEVLCSIQFRWKSAGQGIAFLCFFSSVSDADRSGTATVRLDFVRIFKQICVRLPTTANNVALPAFAAARLLLTAGLAAIDRHLLPAEPIAANPPQQRAKAGRDRQTGQTDRRTDARQLHRPCCVYYARSASNKRILCSD